ncbi:hypothetical protein [Gluconobacter frateurii]|uniref:Uncharacterized protein n=1 Tax=Gluconobacter frateurii NRIC 0228 TaxID=1307946 RepID=A0ABQ0QE80_9PROT|nr:hypothetical protein [Gluconobacter frateurii]GBR15382.1 hypothetical protein AA0228_2498 [Gluconobacter frateurii NRIC 0228]GLP90294.1 hypothetical protein GCM10007868_13690 [Gluconobacter frateurii]
MREAVNATVASKINELEDHQARILDVTFTVDRARMPATFEKNMGIVASLGKRIDALRAGLPA